MRVIYSNLDLYSEENIAKTREYMLDGGFYLRNELTDSAVKETIALENADNWHTCRIMMEQFMADKPFVVFNDSFFLVIRNFSELTELLVDCESYALYDDDGEFFICRQKEAVRELFQMRELTAVGEAYSRISLESGISEKRDRLLISDRFSKPLMFAHIVYGDNDCESEDVIMHSA